MCQRFIEPPFTVLDSKTGRWQSRKRDWLYLGIESEVGRGNIHQSKNSCYTGASKWAGNRGGGYVDLSLEQGTYEDTSGTSVFDPVLCELVYSWFMPEKPSLGILDPFAGGSVRGIVAGRLGYQYNGIELRQEQVEANVKQALEIPCSPNPHWICGDSSQIEKMVGDEYDLLFTCPPYWNLERYSDIPADLSTCDHWGEFADRYGRILNKSARRLKSERFAVVVVGNIRDKNGFIKDMRPVTAQAMKDAGFEFYNDFVLLTSIGSLPLRVNGQFSKGRKAGSAHQYVQVFFHGNPESIKRDFHDFGAEGI